MSAKPQTLRKVASAVAVVLLAAALAGCSSVVDNVPSALGGLPEGTPARPTTQAPYPKVHDMPPARKDAAMSEAEAKRLREDLKLTRNKIAPPPDPAGGAAPNP
jgi:hypothetical protein